MTSRMEMIGGRKRRKEGRIEEKKRRKRKGRRLKKEMKKERNEKTVYDDRSYKDEKKGRRTKI